jgi:hypothetical protein
MLRLAASTEAVRTNQDVDGRFISLPSQYRLSLLRYDDAGSELRITARGAVNFSPQSLPIDLF